MTIAISKPKFEYHDCNCCGTYVLGEFTVSTRHGIFEHFYDGHFGDGDWNGEDYVLYLLAIKDMFNAYYIHLETDEFANTYGSPDEEDELEINDNLEIIILVQESKRKVILEVDNSTYFFPPSVWFDVIEYYEDTEYVDYDVLFKNVFDQLNLLQPDS
jgi:hypothetical protein